MPPQPEGCGNGTVDNGEQCGEPGLPNGPCCSGCRFASEGAQCRAADGPCDLPETCNGFSVECPAGPPKPANTTCNDGNFCNGADACTADGVCAPSGIDPCAGGAECSNTCNADGTCFTPIGAPCTNAGNPCTAGKCDGQGKCASVPAHADEQCTLADCDPNRSVCRDGGCICLPDQPEGCGNGVIDPGEICGEPDLPNGDCCKGCRFAPKDAVCRDANGECDPAEECSGFSADCPADAFAPAEKPCEDGDPCTDADVCADGACTSVRICAAHVSHGVSVVEPAR